MILILLVAAFLRFYNLSGYLQFLGDQGRDVLIVKGMIVEHQWTLLGPNASVGGFFTGPIYYYFMLPFLWLFKLDPVGPAYLSAVFGLATVVLIYWLGREFFEKRVGILAALLVTISPKMIEISRFSWNPNPVPFFALLTVSFLYLAVKKQKIIYTFLTGVCVGVMVQLHYIDLIFVPILFLSILWLPLKGSRWIHILAAGGGFLLGDSLFLIFETRHGFPNSQSVWEFVTRRGQTVAPRSLNFVGLFLEMLRRLYGMLFNLRDLNLLIYPLVLGSLTAFIARPKDKIVTKILLVWLVVGIFGIGSYKGELYDHYFGYLYPLPFLFTALGFDYLLSKKWLVPIFVLGFSTLIYFSVKGWFIWQPPHNMLDQVKEIDKTILDFSQNKPFNLGLISSYNSDYSYRYFLELWDKAPVTIENPQNDPERKTVTSQLMVICENKKCEPLGNSRWEIAGFGRAEIVNETLGPAGIRIFKLIHYKGK